MIASDPPGYPTSYRRALILKDGTKVRVEPIRPSDAGELARAIRTADAETLRTRFLGGAPAVTPELLRELTELDYVRRFALVARHRRKGIAVARYIALDDGSAEVAVAVDPAWRRRGLAAALVELLAERANECGIHQFTAWYMATNRAVAQLAADGHARITIADGVGELAADVPEPNPDAPQS